MRNLFKLIFHRTVLIGLALLLQVLLFSLFLSRFAAYLGWYQALAQVGGVLLSLYIVSGDGEPAYKTAWILLILSLPVFGITIWLLFGNAGTHRRRRLNIGKMNELLSAKLTQDPELLRALSDESTAVARQAHYLRSKAHFPVYGDTATKYYSSGESCYPDMLRDLRSAKHSIYLEYFIIAPGEMWNGILEILTERAAAGVDVRVLYDDFGCIQTLPMRYFRTLEKRGIRCRRFGRFIPICSPSLNNRDHRKLMCIDGNICYTGGINLADEYINAVPRFGYWKDCGLRVEGAAARSMAVTFLSMWNLYEEGNPCPEFPDAILPAGAQGYVQPFADCPLDGEPVSETLFLNMISRAEQSVYITTPYLILDSPMRSALCTAAKSGVDVRIITPGIPDKKLVFSVTRANYHELLAAGVRIFEYTPGFIHAKTLVVDNQSAMVGTVNMDFRSLYLHYENGVFLYKTNSVYAVSRDISETFPLCREIPASYSRRKKHLHLTDMILRALSPLM